MNANRIVAFNLRQQRIARGLSQEALAVDAGIDRTYVSGLERGLENPTVAVLERLAGALDTEIASLFVKPRANARPAAPLKSGRKEKGRS